MSKYCGECGYAPPCIYGTCINVSKPQQAAAPKQTVLRCPNANDSCTYPDCSHTLPEKETPEMFSRKTSGSPEAAIRDIVKTMTYKELTSMARDLGVEAHILDAWASGNFSAQPLTSPIANNDNQKTAGDIIGSAVSDINKRAAEFPQSVIPADRIP